jgi:hypothetical protein
VLATQTRSVIEYDGVVWAGSRDGLFESRDGGVTWTNIVPDIDVRAIRATPSGIFVADRSRLLRRANDGRWVEAGRFDAKEFDPRTILTTSDRDVGLSANVT